MLVNWTKLGLKTIELLNEAGKAEDTIFLLPGWNHISEEKWIKARRNAQVASQIERGVIVEAGKEVTKEVTEVVKEKDKDGKTVKKEKKVEVKTVEQVPFSELEPEEALKIIADTYNMETLAELKKEESRDEIRAAIANRLEEIEKEGHVKEDK